MKINKKHENNTSSGRSRVTLAAGFTVEASLLMVLILLLLVLIIYVSFYLYNDCCIWQGSYLAALHAELEAGSDERKIKEAGAYYKQYLEDSLWAVSGLEHQERVEGFRIQVSAGAVMRVPGAGGFYRNIWELEATGEVKRLRPVTFIRLCNKAGSVREWFEGRDGK